MFWLVLLAALPALGWGQSFNMKDYWPLHDNDTWHYIGIAEEGGTIEDNFRWTVITPHVSSGGKELIPIRTTTDEATDERNNDKDLWYVNPSGGTHTPPQQTDVGSLLFYGVQFGKPKNLGFVSLSEIILTDPILIGGNGSVIGGTNGNDTGSFTATIFGLPTQITVSSNVQYVGFETIKTPLGKFTNALHLIITVSANIPVQAGGGKVAIKSVEVWLGNGLGMLKQDNDVETEARVQAIDSGTVNGNAINGACAFYVTPASQDFDASGGPGAITVNASGNVCGWNAVTTSTWILLTAPASGTGDGVQQYTVAPNATAAVRDGVIRIDDNIFKVHQEAPCVFTLETTQTLVNRNGGGATFGVQANKDTCQWTAIPNQPWIHITGGATGTNIGAITFSADANPGGARTGTITIGNAVHTVKQGPACAASLNPTTANIAGAGATTSVAVTMTDTDCAWSATSSVSWITFPNSFTGFGSGPLNYKVAENIATPRSGIITVNGVQLKVNQAAGAEYKKIEDYILGKGMLTTQEMQFGDINGDGKIDIADLVMMINMRPLAPVNNHWIKAGDGLWSDSANWSLGRVPNSADVVIIDTTGTTPVTVTINTNVTVSDLRIPGRPRFRAGDNLTLSGGTLNVTGPMFMGTGLFKLENNSLLSASGASAVVLVAGDCQLANARIMARSGGRVRLPGLQTASYTLNSDVSLFDVANTDSSINLPGLQSLTFSTGATRKLRLLAGASGTVGGQLLLPMLANITLGGTDSISFEANNGGALDIPLVNTNTRAGFVVGSFSTLSAPHVMGMLTGGNINVGTTATLTLAGVTGISGGAFTVNGALNMPALTSITAVPAVTFGGSATMTAPALASITRGAAGSNPTITLQNNANITLPGLTTLTDVNLTLNHSAHGTFNALTAFTSTNGQSLLQILLNTNALSTPQLSNITNLRIMLRGASLNLPLVTSYLWNQSNSITLFDAASGATLGLQNMTQLSYSPGGGTLTARILGGASGIAGGTVNLSKLQKVITPSTCKVSFEAVNGGAPTLSVLKTTTSLNLVAGLGGTLSLPQVPLLDTCTINVVAGGTLSLPAATSFQLVTVSDNGTLTVPALLSVAMSSSTPFTLGTSAVFSPAALNTIDKVGTSLPTLTVQNDAQATFAGLDSIADVNVTLNNNAKFSAPALTDFFGAGGTPLLTISNSVATFTANNLDGVGNLRINLRGGAQLALPDVTIYNFNNNASATFFDVAGAGSQLNLPNATQINYNTSSGNRTGRILSGNSGVTAGGSILLPMLASISENGTNIVSFETANSGTIGLNVFNPSQGVNFVAGASSTLSVPALAGPFTRATLNAAAGGTLSMPILTALDAVTITDNGTITAPQLATISNTAMTVGTSAVLSLPGLLSLTRGTGTSNPTATFNTNASATFANLASITDVNLTINNNAVVTAPSLAAFTGSVGQPLLTISNSAASLAAPALGNLDNGRINLRGGATLALTSLVAYTWTLNASPTIFDVAGTGSLLDVHNITAIHYNTAVAGAHTLRVNAGASGQPAGIVNLTGWNSAVLGASHTIILTANGAAAQINTGFGALPAGVTASEQNGGSVTP